MLLTTKGKYAIVAVIDMAKMICEKPDEKVSVYKVADKQKISIAYLEQIFAKLRHAGIVISTKGPHGGYIFAKDISQITILDVIHAVEENIKMTNCQECKSTGRINEEKLKCDGHIIWKMLTQHINKFFLGITIKDALENNFNC